MSKSEELTFRRAKVDDIKDVLSMIQELADFEKMSGGPQLTEEDLKRDAGLTGGQEYCEVYVLIDNFTNQTIGYSICYKAYSTWQGRYFFVEDIYVRPEHRKRGAGKRIFLEVSARAVELQCPRLEFNVLEWNPARQFYERLGAVDLTAKEGWHYYRVEGQQLTKLAKDLAAYKS
ncbi:thialysine N-epsilon-acetyltransferase isoform X1 [Drosophila rhopaloa]|uniref:Diamine acetyltransferase 2 isoform X1 n=1 Tax=Drosophila rhopaloa TaxID=1041015 RepID=A0A6P4EKL6_DRORH|nr:thialysine N-epsilon-acetyltransferase isoform X1 [Drosophila rhopaloa]